MSPCGPAAFPCGIPANSFMNPSRARGLYDVTNFLGVMSLYLSCRMCLSGYKSLSISTTSGVFIAIGVSDVTLSMALL